MESKVVPSVLSESFRIARQTCGLLLVVAATCGAVQANGVVPEIDPTTVSGALALLTSGMFLCMGSRRK